MSLSPSGQLLLRNSQRLGHGRVLLLCPPPDTLCATLQRRHSQEVTALCHTVDDTEKLRNQGIDAEFALQTTSRNYAAAVVFLPKGRAYARFNLALAASHVSVGGSLWLVGENRAGIKSHAATLAPYGPVRKLDSARHCTLFATTLQTSVTFDWRDQLEFTQLTAEHVSLSAANLPGVFSAGKLDAGTRLLLDHLPDTRPDRVLDIACGCGVIGAVAKSRWPDAELMLADHHLLAVTASRETLRANALEGWVLASDVYGDIPGRFDLILSNPPFHAGIATHYAAAQQLIRKAPQHLNPGGLLQIVANRFLPYPQWFGESFGGFQKVADNGRFCVYRALAWPGERVGKAGASPWD